MIIQNAIRVRPANLMVAPPRGERAPKPSAPSPGNRLSALPWSSLTGSMTEVESSAIAAICYDPPARELIVEFKGSGDRYVYEKVSDKEYRDFIAAESIGKHFCAHIKPNHAFRKLQKPPEPPARLTKQPTPNAQRPTPLSEVIAAFPSYQAYTEADVEQIEMLLEEKGFFDDQTYLQGQQLAQLLDEAAMAEIDSNRESPVASNDSWDTRVSPTAAGYEALGMTPQGPGFPAPGTWPQEYAPTELADDDIDYPDDMEDAA